ncbi:MAG: tRNA (adenosine(37)-N6)-threonylcarbamoyltransferase complex ATPase subunit type 1 TsaE [Waddliaceae bacterium]|nr:tRNA (adenosine(37)-N6)-threonylcarbamoyltransferase complex ATPase subunit type 1 TsaE [Waddliaceae bacterium]
MEERHVQGCIEEFFSKSHEETISLGRSFARTLEAGSVICFSGDLGAGKTTFMKGLISELTHCLEEEVNSPTFIYMNEYHGPTSVYHFDLYRLSSAEEFFAMGFDETFTQESIVCIEWAERLEDLAPEDCIHISVCHCADGRRNIQIKRPM